MVDLTTSPPDPGAVTVHPRLGVSNANASNAIPRAATELAEIGGAFLKNRRENRDARSLAGFILEQVTTKRDNAAAILSNQLNVALSEKDVDDLQSAAVTVRKLDALRVQRPGRIADTFERVEKLRQSVAANPRLAPEFLQMFEAAGGASVGTQLSQVITEAEDQQASLIQSVEDKSIEMGLNPGLPFEQRAGLVYAHEQLRTLAFQSSQRLAILNAKEDTQRITILNEVNNIMVPAATADMANILRGEVAKLRLGLSGTNPSPDARKALMFQMSTRVAGIKQSLVTLGGSKISPSDIESSLSGINQVMETLNTWLTGDGDLKILNNAVEMLEVSALYDIYGKNPMFPTMASIVEIFFRNNPMAGSLMNVEFMNKFHPIYEAGLANLTRGYNLASTLANRNLTETQQLEAFDLYGQNLAAIAVNPDVDDATFGRVLAGAFKEYRDNPDNPRLTSFLNTIMDDLSNPAVMERLKSALVKPEDKANILTGLEFYITDAIESASIAIGEQLAATAPFTRQFPSGEFANLGALSRRTGPTFDSLIETSIGVDGTPLFLAKDRTDLRALKAVDELNRRGAKIGEASRVFEALGLDNLKRSPAEITADILSTGTLPGIDDTPPVIPDADAIPQEIELRVVRSEKELNSIALGMESDEERAQFLRDQGVPLPVETRNFVILEDGTKLPKKSRVN